VIDRMLADGELRRVQPSRELAERLLVMARAHLRSAAAIGDQDPDGGYAMAYDAARKALTAILENQGLRPATGGHHLAVYSVVVAQLDPPLGATLRPFDRMRRQRRAAEYPPVDAPELTGDDVRDDLPKVLAIIELAAGVLDEMAPY
jgi:hypothetical protein